MAIKLGRRKVMRCALEAVAKGTPAVTVSTETLVYDPKCNPTDTMIARGFATAFAGARHAKRGPKFGTLSYRAECRGNGTTGLDAGLLVALQCCGMKLSSLVLTPDSDIEDQKTGTFDTFEDGRKKQLYASAGDWSLDGENGGLVMFGFQFQGLFGSVTDAALPTPTQTAQAPMMAASCLLTLGGHTPVVSRFSIKANNVVSPRRDITKAHATAYHLVGDRRFTIELDPEAEPVATWDAYGLWDAETEGAFSLTLTDGLTNIVIAAPKCQVMPPSDDVRDTQMVDRITLQCNPDAGDDELTITTSAVV